jgi:hypothetical protein
MIAITTNSSTSVKPEPEQRPGRLPMFRRRDIQPPPLEYKKTPQKISLESEHEENRMLGFAPVRYDVRADRDRKRSNMAGMEKKEESAGMHPQLGPISRPEQFLPPHPQL